MAQQRLPYLPQQEQQSVPSFNILNDRLARSAGFSDIAHIEGRPRPIEVDLTNSRNLAASMLPPLPASYDYPSDYQFAAHSRTSPRAAEAGARVPNTLSEWYFSRDGPWDPIQGKNAAIPRSPDARTRTRPAVTNPQGRVSFTQFRGSTVASECETLPSAVLPSDSGYESRTRPSVGNPSVYGDHDRSADTQSIVGQLGGFQLDGLQQDGFPHRESNLPRDGYPQPGISNPATSSPDTGGNRSLVCPFCHKTVKTKSELNKHEKRHTKPFRCTEAGCHRVDGFSTMNDLDRHKRCCHPDANAAGNRFRCALGACRNKTKIWPRADNFRSHLKRVHQYNNISEEELENFVYRETPTCNPDLAGLGSSVIYEIPMNISPTSLLPPANWLIDQRPDLETLEERTGLGNNSPPSYIGDAMDFQDTSDLVASPSYPIISPPDRGQSRTPGVLKPQMESVQESQDDPSVTRPPESQSQSDAAEASSGSPDSGYFPSEFLKDSPMSDNPAEEAAEPEKTPKEVIAVDEDASNDIPQKEIREASVSSPNQQPPDSSAENPSAEIARTDPIPTEDEEATQPPLPSDSAQEADDVSPTADKEDNARTVEVSERLQSTPSSNDIIDVDEARTLFKSLHEKGELEKLLEEFGYPKAKVTCTKAKKAPSIQSQGSENNQHHCSKCSKSFPRQCELKKHMKRHEKPYGCTFPPCSKRFGSKNDWKRHENSQHFQLEMWKCNEPGTNGASSLCGKACHRRETFKYHLMKDHNITAPEAIDERLKSCSIGRHSDDKFWCGFCEKVVTIYAERGLKALTGRFDHIDAHFSGRLGPKMDISQWKSPDPDLPDLSFDSPSGSEDGSSQGSPPELSKGSSEPTASSAFVKRKREEHDTASRPSKRSKVDQDNSAWFCCHCRSMNLVATADRCTAVTCSGHERCEECAVEACRTAE
ncbi:C2H2 and C2HC zinc finger [Pleurostoma richardsiae]|uniref:C2H2 and C2HC zinc finger n=1 Tax=Pleurostoma richardsiae TaxID=41990 RepID=A0AA38VPN2_9PEZI|nr:C2H2 and C2HC zinc finger [Pleurostoma richardsiae]